MHHQSVFMMQTALTQDWPRLSHCRRGIILNDDCFYISLHFLCVPLTMPLFYFLSPSLPLLPSLFTFIGSPSTENNNHPHTCTTNCSACVFHMSPYNSSSPLTSQTEALCSAVLPCRLPTETHPVELSEQDKTMLCVLVMFFWRALQSSSSEPEHKFSCGAFVIFSVHTKQNLDNKLA